MILASFFQVPKLDDLLKLLPNLKFIIFDMDGTLVDTEEEHALSIVTLLRRLSNKPFVEKEIYQLVFGRPDPYSFESLQKMFDLKMDLEKFLDLKHEVLEDIISKNLKPKPIITQDLIREITACSQIQFYTVVTASERKTANSVLGKKFTNVFKQFFTREDTVKSKPYPDPYFHAIEAISGARKFKKDEILIIEDSPTGLASAIASGNNVLRAYWYTYKSKG